MYETYPNKFEENQYNIKEQMRLKRNIEKLRALEYLNVQPRIIDTITNVFKHNNLI